MSYQDVNNVVSRPVRRAETPIQELNWLYGVTEPTWGIPMRKMSVWAAAGGVGKSRLAITLAKKLTTIGVPYKGRPYPIEVLYFQNEVDVSTFKSWVGSGSKIPPNKLFVSTDCSVDEQIKTIMNVKPYIVIIDSIQMLYEFSGASDNGIKAIINGTKEKMGYRDILKKLNCHIIFISQLTKAGDPKGSTMITHLADQVFLLSKLDKIFPDRFVFRVGDKNRCGRVGEQFTSWWQHLDDGVVCESDFRLEDEKWCKSHNIPMKKNKMINNDNKIKNNDKKPFNFFGNLKEELFK